MTLMMIAGMLLLRAEAQGNVLFLLLHIAPLGSTSSLYGSSLTVRNSPRAADAAVRPMSNACSTIHRIGGRDFPSGALLVLGGPKQRM